MPSVSSECTENETFSHYGPKEFVNLLYPNVKPQPQKSFKCRIAAEKAALYIKQGNKDCSELRGTNADCIFVDGTETLRNHLNTENDRFEVFNKKSFYHVYKIHYF